jgi:RNA polymerase sigma factor (sigma-70 family)
VRTDTQLIALIREGHDGAFEILFNRYQPRLLAFCRRMVGSPQDAEDVLQEVFAAAHAAILADDRAINVRPWLYRIARNRCLSHLRKPPTADGVDSMDVHPHENGTSTLEQVQRREELRAIVSDVHELPKTQRTALVLREIDDRSYADIAQAMNTTLPSVKSLMVRARMSLSESVAARGALVPFGLLALLRKLIPAKLGGSSGAGGTAGTAGSVGSAGSAAGAAGATGGVAAGGSSVALGGVLSATSTAITGVGGALGAKAAVGVATAALLTAGVVGVEKVNSDGQKATPSADRVGASAGPGTTDEIGSSSAHAAPGSAAKAARAAGTAAGAGQGRGPGSKAGRAAVDHAHSLKAAVGHAVGRSRAAEVAAAARNTVHAAAQSQLPAVSHAAGALVKPPKSVAPGLGRIIEPPRPRPVRPPSGHPLPIKPPNLPLKPPKLLPTPGALR